MVIVEPPPHGTGLLLSSKHPETVIVEVIVEPPPHGTGLLLSSKQPVTVIVDGGGTAGQLVSGPLGLISVQLPVSVMVDVPPFGPQSVAVVVLVMMSPGTVSVTAAGQEPVQAAQVEVSRGNKCPTGLAPASKLMKVNALKRCDSILHTLGLSLQAGRGESCWNAY